jgi:hypothetical protein
VPHIQVRPSKDLRNHYIIAELEKAEQEAADPNTNWYTHDEVWSEIWERRKKNV